ncbi:hypothetical protein CH337_00665 [Rhodoblastus acidophilus]|nr:hypothetical protein CKO16_05285 [Rhodoblastus acidophilus]RAI24429.1 hypothetical protein CH337_00665 [Rhodoblastus acidophilus]
MAIRSEVILARITPRRRKRQAARFLLQIVRPLGAAMTVVLPDTLKRFIWDFQSVVELAENPRELLVIGGDVFRRALDAPDLAPPAFAAANPSEPQLYQLYADALARFAVAILALAPNQEGPVLPGAGWRLAGLLSGAAIRRSEGGAEARLAQGQMETARAGGGAAQYSNDSPDRPALLLLAFDAADLAAPAAPSFANGPDNPPFDIFTIQTRIEA